MIYYVALPFTRIDEDGLAPGEAVECASAAAAVRRADALARRPPNIGSVAFSRQGSPDLGDFEEAVVLCIFGEVPEDIPRIETGN